MKQATNSRFWVLGKGYWIALYLFYKNEVYTDRLVEFRIDGLDNYLRTSHESY